MNLEVSFVSTSSRGTGGNGQITIVNKGGALTNWSFQVNTGTLTVDSFWQLTKTGTGSQITISPPSWSTSFSAGQTISCGFGYTGTLTSSTVIQSLTTGVKIVGQTTSTPTTTTTPVTTTPVTTITSFTNKVAFGYFSEWSIYDRKFSVSQIPVNNLTHVVYAFMLPNPSQADYNLLASKMSFPPKPYTAPPTVPEGALVSQDSYAQSINLPALKTMKSQYPHIKVLISVGGWTMSWTFSKVAKDATLRKNFITSSVDFIVSNGFDGIDIDWEFLGKQGIGYNYVDSVNDGPNFITLVKEMRAYMDTKSPNKHLQITAAIGTSPDVIVNYKGSEPYL